MIWTLPRYEGDQEVTNTGSNSNDAARRDLNSRRVFYFYLRGSAGIPKDFAVSSASFAIGLSGYTRISERNVP